MLSLYRPGRGFLHRMPTALKLVLLLALTLTITSLPSTWLVSGIIIVVVLVAYSTAGLHDGAWGFVELGRQLYAIRWLIALTLVSQWIFLTPEDAVANTVRVSAAIVIAGLITLTTRVTDLLNTVERSLAPLKYVRLRPDRAALTITIALSALPTLMQFAREIREAHQARGVRTRPWSFILPFLVASLKHADQVGDALTARGID